MFYDLIVLLYIIGGCLTFALCMTLIGMLWAGKIAFPGTQAYRVMTAKNKVKIAEFQAEEAEFKFRAAQTTVNREEMEALFHQKLSERLEAAKDAAFYKELERGNGNESS